MKNMSITEVFVSTPPLSGNGIRRGLVIVKDIKFGLFQNCFIMDIFIQTTNWERKFNVLEIEII